jgi:RNA polymerase sigma factor (sigma-70 family)
MGPARHATAQAGMEQILVTESGLAHSLSRPPRRSSIMGVDKHGLKQLLRRALAGDACAWSDFFREVRKYLHAEVKKALGPNGHVQVENSVVVQSALRRIWEGIGDQFREGPEDVALHRFLAWISMIVRNRTYEELRRRKPRPIEAAGAAIENIAEPRPVGQAVQRARLAAALAAALARVPERDRQVIELFWFERLSDAEIGQRLGCSMGAIRVIRFRALRKLRSPELRTLLEECHDGRC